MVSPRPKPRPPPFVSRTAERRFLPTGMILPRGRVNSNEQDPGFRIQDRSSAAFLKPSHDTSYPEARSEDTDCPEKRFAHLATHALVSVVASHVLTLSHTRSPQPVAQATVLNERDSSWAAPSRRCYVICGLSISMVSTSTLV